MNSRERNIYKTYLLDLIKNINPDKKINEKQLIKCPLNCSEEETAQVYKNQITCHNPSCPKKVIDIFDYVKIIKPIFKTKPDREIASYIKHQLKIEIKDDTDDLLKKYHQACFALIPLIGGHSDPKMNKVPIKEAKEWEKSEHKNPRIWKDWVDRGYNIGLNLGKVSGVIAVDIDSQETYEKVKPLLGDTLRQTTGRGWHFIYNYDPDFVKTLNKVMRDNGYDMELRTDGAYCVVAPSSCAGETRVWNDKKITDMPEDLKSLFLKHQNKNLVEKTVDEEIQEAINKNDLGIKSGLVGLEGCCNDAFIKLGGVLRKKLNAKQTHYTLNMFNSMLASPMDQKTMFGMMRQLKKYHTYDKEELSKEVLDRLGIIKEGSAFQMSKSLGHEQRDVEEVLHYLEKEGHVVSLGQNRYKRLDIVEWEEDWKDLSVPLDFEVPYFHNYAYFDQGNMLIIGAGTGVGKCFGKGTDILMYNGKYKKVENIQIGDQLMGVDSKPRIVLDLSKGVDDLYKIIPNKGKECIVNSRHILSLKRSSDQKIVNIPLNEYLEKSNNFKHLFKMYSKSVNFEEKQVPLEPYFLGLWLGDGDCRDSRITNQDKEIEEYVTEYSKRLKLSFRKYKYGDKCQSVKIINKKNKYSVYGELKKLSLLQNKHIPDVYKFNSRENRLQLLAGLLDTDGYLSGGNFEIMCKSKKLADDIRYVSGSLGFKVTEKIKNVKLKTWSEARPYYRLNIIGDCSTIPTKIERKKAKIRKINKDPLVTGFEIEKIGKGDYYGFELDGDHLHMIEDFVVHHNTHIVGNIIKKLVDQGIRPDLLTTEAGSKIGKVCDKLGLKVGDFRFKEVKDPSSVEFSDNSVTIIDWLKPPEGNYAKTDHMFEQLHEQLKKHSGFLIVFVQMRKDGTFFAKDQIDFYAALVASYQYNENGGVKDNENTFFKTSKIRDSRTGKQFITIKTKFDRDTKVLDVVD